MDFLGTALHKEGITISVDVDSRVHRQPNPTRFFKYDLFNESKADVYVQMDTYSCFFTGFVNGLMLARNQVNISKLAYGICPGCCGNVYDPVELRLMFDSFALSGVRRLALWNLDDNQPGKGKKGWPPELLSNLAAFLSGNERDLPKLQATVLKADDDEAAAGAESLWPLPESVQCAGAGIPLGAGFKVHTVSGSAVVIAAAARYTKLFAPAPLSQEATAARTLSGVMLVVNNTSEELSVETRYDYTLTLSSTGTEVTASVSSPYGAVAALETFGQLLSGCTAGSGCSRFNCTTLTISDSPVFRHRGLMIDAEGGIIHCRW